MQRARILRYPNKSDWSRGFFPCAASSFFIGDPSNGPLGAAVPQTEGRIDHGGRDEGERRGFGDRSDGGVDLEIVHPSAGAVIGTREP